MESKQEDKIPVNYSYRPNLDVLAGRSERIKKNNLFYRLQIHQHFAVYNDCENHDKRHVAQLIVHAVQRRGGRFLDPQGKVMTDRKAVKKTMKALKDLRKTHGRTAPECLPPRLAKMTVKAQKQAAAEATAAAKLMELQQHHCLEPKDTMAITTFCQTPRVRRMFAPERTTPTENHFIPLEMHHEPCQARSYHPIKWDNATKKMIAAEGANEEMPASPSEVTLEGQGDEEQEQDLYEPLPLDYPTQEYEPLALDYALKEDACPSPIQVHASEVMAASLTFV